MEELGSGIWKELFSVTVTAAPNWDRPHVEDVEMQKDGIYLASIRIRRCLPTLYSSNDQQPLCFTLNIFSCLIG